jgi:hypothetical protein
MLAPARSIICAYAIVFLTSGNIRNLAVTGIDRFVCSVLTVNSRSDPNIRQVPNFLTKLVDQIPFVLQERAVFSSLRDTLRATTAIEGRNLVKKARIRDGHAQVDVDRITVLLHTFCCLQ